MNRRERLVGTVRAVIRGVRSDRITFIAASLAYYAFISLIPLLLLALVATAVFGGPALADRIVASTSAALGAETGALVEGALTEPPGRGGAAVVGLLVLAWSALKLFRGLDVAFSTVYGTVAEETLLDNLRDGTVGLLAVTIGAAATVAVGALAGRIDWIVGGIDVVDVVGPVVLVGGLSVTFLPMYYIFPDVDLDVRDALPGAVLAAVGWVLLQVGFRAYTRFAGSYEAYGVLGGVLLLITFLYFGGLVLLVGAVVNATLADRLDAGTDLDAGTGPDGVSRPAGQRGPEPAVEPTAEGVELTRAGASLEPTVDEEGETADPSDSDLEEQVRELRADLAEFEERIDERTVHRDEVERDLKRYVRRRIRAGKARGWGPYLVLLYGTAMTLGAFYYLSDLAAVFAMFVIWLSTLGLYVLMLIVGAGLSAASLPGRLYDRLESLR